MFIKYIIAIIIIGYASLKLLDVIDYILKKFNR